MTPPVATVPTPSHSATSPVSVAVRTRIAPSPTGFLHLGTARTALYSWAFARHFGGEFVLRIEDTDVERSSDASAQQISDAMHWLGLTYDEGPIYQMQRIARYHEVIETMLAAGTAYRCWATPAELDAMREAQKARGEKTHYDGRWRPSPGKVLPAPPAGVQPVVRFANPAYGVVEWEDLVKGKISIHNAEFDDLILLRPAEPRSSTDLGVPTYNFAVVVDDLDMRITHVFRGDEHINNTPWQINLFHALGAKPPQYGHCPIILGDDGLKLSKRRGAVSVTAYEEAGYLPEAMLNYLARLGWSHGDEEVFSVDQLVQWFDGSHLSRSPAQWDAAKLNWVNSHHLKLADNRRLANWVSSYWLKSQGLDVAVDDRLDRLCGLFKQRSATLMELADQVHMAYAAPEPSAELLAAHVPDVVRPALLNLAERLVQTDWNAAGISSTVKAVLASHSLKMPQLAPAIRVLVCGSAQTPSIDAVLELIERSEVVRRIRRA